MSVVLAIIASHVAVVSHVVANKVAVVQINKI